MGPCLPGSAAAPGVDNGHGRRTRARTHSRSPTIVTANHSDIDGWLASDDAGNNEQSSECGVTEQADDPFEQRKKLSFAQAEGIAPLPQQLKPREISQEFRAILWDLLRDRLEKHRRVSPVSGEASLENPWLMILKEAHVYFDHRLDDFPTEYRAAAKTVKDRIEKGDWLTVLGWLEWIFKHPNCPAQFAKAVDAFMAHARLGYRVFDNVLICPVGSDAERLAIEQAFADVAATEFHGARAHLRKAAERLSAGEFADSVRESIHAVEATARVIETSGALSSALGRLENSAKIHPAMKRGFGNLYGYTSDENGIRHALLDDGTAKVDETDALFMIGACAAFVSYLINKARVAGLL
jgi:hypothetical protein